MRNRAAWWGMNRSARPLQLLLAALTGIAMLVALPAPALAPAGAAGHFIVDTTADSHDADPGDGSCADASGACSLRAAIEEANATTGALVEVLAGVYLLSLGELVVAAPMTIQGAALATGGTDIDAQSGSRVFRVTASGVVIAGVAARNGSTTGNGGAILVARNASVDLRNATLRDSDARRGGGLFVASSATATVSGVTLLNNEASDKGGGARIEGAGTFLDSTLTSNLAKSGGGASISGVGDFSFVTVAFNTATNKPGGGIARNGGVVRVRNSIVTANLANSGSGHDCSGTPDLLGLNLVSVLQGCNPVGPVLVGPGGLGPLADYGGPTFTHALQPGSLGHDAVDPTECTDLAGNLVAIDQRGVARPQDVGCELGAYEIAPLSVTGVSLSTDVSQIGVGAATVPVENLLAATVETADPGTSIQDLPLGRIPLGSIPLGRIPLGSIGTQASPLGSILLGEVPLGNIAAALAPLGSIDPGAADVFSLDSVLLSELTFDESVDIDGLIAEPYAGVPKQAITLADILALPGVADITLDQVSLGSTPLGSISTAALVLLDLPLGSIAFDPSLVGSDETAILQAWCDDVIGTTLCEELGILSGGGVDTVADDDVTLVSLSLAGVDIADLNLNGVPLGSIPLGSIPLEGAPLGSIDFAVSPLGSIPLGSILLAIDCNAVDCDTGTLADAQAAGAIIGGTVGDLLSLPESVIGQYGLGDLLIGLLPPSDLPWEEIDLRSTPLQAAADPKEPAFHYMVDFTLDGPGNAEITVDLTLPEGFAYASDLPLPASIDGTAVGAPVITGSPLTGSLLSFVVPDVPIGSHTLAVAVRAGIDLGFFEGSVVVSASKGTESDSDGPATASIEVVEASEGVVVALTGDGDVNLAHISSTDSTDLYSFEILPGGNAPSARLLLSDLPADFDLALFGPPLEAPLRGTPQPGVGLVEDKPFDLNPDDEVLTTDILEDIPLDPPVPGMVLHAVSAARGLTDEEIDTGTLLPGTYYVQVSAYHGVFSTAPYALRGRLREGPPLPTCTPRSFAFASPAPETIPNPLPTGKNTVFVTNWQRLVATFGPVEAQKIRDQLVLVAGTAWSDLGVDGFVLYLDGDPAVRAAYTALDADRCTPERSNDVVRAVGSLLDDVVAANPGLENVVIVGDDGIVPFARIPDGVFYSNERTHRVGSGNDELNGALGAGFFLSDDPYGAEFGLAVNDHELFIPTRAVGRLVETPDDIAQALANFVIYDGRLDPATAAGPAAALVTGYDFLTDGAQLIASALQPLFDVAELINETWDRDDLITALGTGRAVASVNAHFDQTRALPALSNLNGTENDEDLFTTDDLAIARTLFVSMGCHALLSSSDVQLGTAVPDFAQVLAASGNLAAGNTGYGYGDTEIVALSERLNAEFAAELTSRTVGEAWWLAKQIYIGQLPILTPYDEKVSQQFVLYGLPMYVVGRDHHVTTAGTLAATGSLTEIGPQLATADSLPTGTDPITGLTIAATELDLVVGGPSGPGRLNLVITSDGGYYEVDGQTLTVQGRPIQPQTSVDVTQSGLVATGALITELVSQGIPNFDAVTFSPTVDTGSSERRPASGDDTFPARTHQVTGYVGPDGPVQELQVIPGRFTAGFDPGVGTQELFTHFAFTVFYTTPGTPPVTPLIRQSSGTVGDGIVYFDVEVDDAARVMAAFRPTQTSGSTPWEFVELGQVPGSPGTWIGGRPAANPAVEEFEYFLQAVSSNGYLAQSNGKAINFETTQPAESSDVSFLVTGDLGGGGWYLGDVNVEAESINGGVASFSIDNAPFQAYPAGGFVVSGDGGHIVRVIDVAGEVGVLFVAIDTAAPSSAALVEPVDGDWNTSVATVTLTAADGVLSGVASITYSLSGAVNQGPLTVPGDEAVFDIGTDGTTTVTFFATDVAGNVEAAQAVQVLVDVTGPVTSLSVAPGANAAGWHDGEVTVTAAASDTTSGVASITYGATGAGAFADVATSLNPVDVVVLAEGTTTVSASATDVAGNVGATSSVVVKVDKTDPASSAVVTPTPVSGWNAGPVSVDVSAVDGLSGVASVTYAVSGAQTTAETTVAGDAVSVPVSAEGISTVTFFATDVAGNVEVAQSIAVRIDTTAPVSSATVTPAPTAGWNGGSVSVEVSAVDGLSGVASITYAVSGAQTTAETTVAGGAVSVPVSAEGISTVTFYGTDVAGNVEAAQTITVRIDTTAPAISITSPTDDQVVTLGEVVPAAYTCDDGAGSGVARCAGDVAIGDPIDSSTFGSLSFTVIATDLVGNEATATVTYTTDYAICLLYDPDDAKNVGSVIPIKVQLCDANGANLSSRQITLTAVLIDGTTEPPPNDAGGANQGFRFRFSKGGDAYIYNLDTDGMTVGAHTLDFVIEGDAPGHTHSAPFTLR